jgi:hypothetical protein
MPTIVLERTKRKVKIQTKARDLQKEAPMPSRLFPTVGRCPKVSERESPASIPAFQPREPGRIICQTFTKGERRAQLIEMGKGKTQETTDLLSAGEAGNVENRVPRVNAQSLGDEQPGRVPVLGEKLVAVSHHHDRAAVWNKNRV